MPIKVIQYQAGVDATEKKIWKALSRFSVWQDSNKNSIIIVGAEVKHPLFG
jgi:hypothetical protein